MIVDNLKISHVNVDQFSAHTATHYLKLLTRGQTDILIMVNTSVRPAKEKSYARSWNSAIPSENNSQNFKGGTVIVHRSDLFDLTSFVIHTRGYLSHQDFELSNHTYRLLSLYGPASSEDKDCQPFFHKVFSEECINKVGSL